MIRPVLSGIWSGRATGSRGGRHGGHRSSNDGDTRNTPEHEWSLQTELHVVESFIEALFIPDKVCMTPDFTNSSSLDHNNGIGVLDG